MGGCSKKKNKMGEGHKFQRYSSWQIKEQEVAGSTEGGKEQRRLSLNGARMLELGAGGVGVASLAGGKRAAARLVASGPQLRGGVAGAPQLDWAGV